MGSTSTSTIDIAIAMSIVDPMVDLYIAYIYSLYSYIYTYYRPRPWGQPWGQVRLGIAMSIVDPMVDLYIYSLYIYLLSTSTMGLTPWSRCMVRLGYIAYYIASLSLSFSLSIAKIFNWLYLLNGESQSVFNDIFELFIFYILNSIYSLNFFIAYLT